MKCSHSATKIRVFGFGGFVGSGVVVWDSGLVGLSPKP